MDSKDYDNWNEIKKNVSIKNRVFFDKGEIWFMTFGKNVGDEEDGKNQFFERPILIIRKFNNNIFLGIPLTSNPKVGKYYFTLTSFKDSDTISTAILSQIRLFDAKRLLRFMGKIDHQELLLIKEKTRLII